MTGRPSTPLFQSFKGDIGVLDHPLSRMMAAEFDATRRIPREEPRSPAIPPRRLTVNSEDNAHFPGLLVRDCRLLQEKLDNGKVFHRI
jgi:hypothetical protein